MKNEPSRQPIDSMGGPFPKPAAKPDCAPANGSVWSKKKPQNTGFYWLRIKPENAAAVVHVEQWHGELQVFYHGGWRPFADKEYWRDVEWWPAPINPPPNESSN